MPVTTLLSRLRASRRGVAMMEFAMAAPLIITVGAMGIETANYVITVQRVNQLAMMASDNAGRVRTTMDEQDVNEIMLGMGFAGKEIQFGERGRLILSSLVSNNKAAPNAGFTFNWQRCFGARDVASNYGAEGYGANNAALANGISNGSNRVTPVSGSALMVAEIKYTYKPILATYLLGNRDLYAVQVFPVRERVNQTLSNTTNMSAAARRLCDAQHLSAT